MNSQATLEKWKSCYNLDLTQAAGIGLKMSLHRHQLPPCEPLKIDLWPPGIKSGRVRSMRWIDTNCANPQTSWSSPLSPFRGRPRTSSQCQAARPAVGSVCAPAFSSLGSAPPHRGSTLWGSGPPAGPSSSQSLNSFSESTLFTVICCTRGDCRRRTFLFAGRSPTEPDGRPLDRRVASPEFTWGIRGFLLTTKELAMEMLHSCCIFCELFPVKIRRRNSVGGEVTMSSVKRFGEQWSRLRDEGEDRSGGQLWPSQLPHWAFDTPSACLLKANNDFKGCGKQYYTVTLFVLHWSFDYQI